MFQNALRSYIRISGIHDILDLGQNRNLNLHPAELNRHTKF